MKKIFDLFDFDARIHTTNFNEFITDTVVSVKVDSNKFIIELANGETVIMNIQLGGYYMDAVKITVLNNEIDNTVLTDTEISIDEFDECSEMYDTQAYFMLYDKNKRAVFAAKIYIAVDVDTDISSLIISDNINDIIDDSDEFFGMDTIA